MTQQEVQQYRIDAAGKKLGRVAAEAASVLLGKNRTDFAKNVVAPVQVVIEHASALAIDEKKRDQKTYERYSGYPGGRKVFKMKEVIAKKGYAEVLYQAIARMLPRNRLRKARLKNLQIIE